jgi:hypothetical protein
VLDCSVFIPKVEALREIVENGLKWRDEVQSMIDSQKAVSMRRVDALLTLAETLPFDFTSEVEKLRDKKIHAKLWLDKIKRTFSIKASTSEYQSMRRKAAAESTDEVDRRVGLHDMKMMVEEGQLLLDYAEDGADGSSGSKAHSRELQKAQTIVDMADQVGSLSAVGTGSLIFDIIILVVPQWLERVKSMLSAEVPTSIFENYDSSPEGEEEMNQFVSELREMLREADTMPVVMDEMLVLRVQVQALDWAKKVRPILKQISTIRLADIQKHYKDICKIRNSLPEGVADDYPGAKRMLPEEITCRDIITKAESWLEQLKKVNHAISSRRSVSLDKIVEIFRGSEEIEVDVDQELKSLRATVKAALSWFEDNVAFLKKVDAVPTSESNPSETSLSQQLIQRPNLLDLWKLRANAALENEQVEDLELKPQVVSSVSNPSSVVTMEVDMEIDSPVSFTQIACAVGSAANLSIDFDELKTIKAIFTNADTWKSKVEEALSTNTTASRSSRKGTKAKRATNDSFSFVNHKATLESLLLEADNLKVDVANEKQRIMNVLNLSRAWDASASSKLDELKDEDASNAIKNAASSFFRLEASVVLNYPFLRGIDTEIDMNPQKAWCDALHEAAAMHPASVTATTKKLKEESDVEDVMDDIKTFAVELTQLLVEAESKGMVCSNIAVLVRLCVACIQWGLYVRDYLRIDLADRAQKRKSWGDIDASVADELTKAYAAFDSLVEEDKVSMDATEEDADVNLIANTWRDKVGDMSAKTNAAIDVVEAYLSKRSMNNRPDDGDEGDGDKLEVESNADPTTASTAAAAPLKGRAMKGKAVEPSAASTTQQLAKKVKLPIVTKLSQRIKDKIDYDVMEEVVAADNKADSYDGDENTDFHSSASTLSSILRNLHNLCQQYRDIAPEDSTAIPPAVLHFLTAWRAMLDLFLLRRRELQVWSNRKQKIVARSISSVANSTGKNCHEEVSMLLQIAKSRYYDNAEYKDLLQLAQAAITWQKSAKGMLSRDSNHPLLSIDDLKAFVRQGEQQLFDLPEIVLLRAELKKAKQWKTRVDRLGDKLLQADDAEIAELVEDAKGICVDLSEHLQSVTEAKLKYCLCRQEYHSEMVGCDTCNEWYHCACIGISKSTADKLDSFSCIRCTLITSFENSAVTAAQTVNRWMVPENVARWREQASAKVSIDDSLTASSIVLSILF